MNEALQSYLKKITAKYKHGDATEQTYYSVLENLLGEIADTIYKKKVHITNIPKRTEAGNPDFKITDGKQHLIGYIEAKDIGADLDKIEDTEQLQRYIKTFPNVVLTNFTDFWLYRDGKLIDKISVARTFVLKELGKVPAAENEDKFQSLFEKFFNYSIPKSYSAKSLAVELAKRTRFLKEQVVVEELRFGTKDIIGFHNAFKEFLIAGISEDEFADLYSQTITYGLFAARLRADKEFNRKLAIEYIPKTIGILRDIFRFISSTDLPEQMQSIVDDISEVLAVAETKNILDEYFHEHKGSDPVLHFYETFLEVYDPATREKCGVYYTPEPVVSFIVHSLHQILKNKFGMENGLASKEVTLLDPAGGTLSFLAKAIQVAVKEMEDKIGRGIVPAIIKNPILQNYYAFELMMAPYAIGHMKISFLLEELGYKLADEDRVKYYLTNTLEMKELEESRFPGMSSLSTESHEAGKVKSQVPILVVLGNPPYSGHSSNVGEWISKEIKEYYQVDGKPLGEKNPKWLQDDYVKFIRFAQWKIDQAGSGVIGFITNHSYLDNPTFRGMRQSLMNSFDEIYILDLHGNSLKKEKCPDGSKDENVFDIMQGVAIAFFVKNKKEYKSNKVFHTEIFGLRENKYKWLLKDNIGTVKWKGFIPRGNFYLFVPTNNKLQEQYDAFPGITEIFPVNSVGIVTARDSFVIDFDKKKLERRIKEFVDPKVDEDIIRRTYDLKENQSWKIQEQREKLRSDLDWKDSLTKILYRPFDERWILYHDEMVERTRKEVMKNMFKENLALITSRQTQGEFKHIFISEHIIEFNLTGSAGRYGSGFIFPLYIYPISSKIKTPFVQLMMFEPEVKYHPRQPNISQEIFNNLKKDYKKEVTPEEIFYYVYAVLYSNTYRTKYVEFLKIDFPRIPFTKNYKLFIKLGNLGEKLVDLHLLKSKELDDTGIKFPVLENNKVEKLKYENEEVWINSKQYFSPVKEEIWKYQIGGYQVCDKWLKDRKGRTLDGEEITTYCRILASLSNTIDIQKEIDLLYKEVEKNL